MKVTIKFIVYIFTLLFLDDEMAPGTPNSHEMHQARSYFQPKLDLQRFQQYVAEEQSRYVEQPEQPHLNGCGPDHVALKGQGSDHLALYGRGNHHVTGHDSMLPGSAQDKPDLYPHASQPYFYPQGAVSTVGTIRNDQASGAFITGHGTDHVVPPGSVASRTDHASQQATFLSQESVEIVAGSGPSVVNPGAASLYVACHPIFFSCKKKIIIITTTTMTKTSYKFSFLVLFTSRINIYYGDSKCSDFCFMGQNGNLLPLKRNQPLKHQVISSSTIQFF